MQMYKINGKNQKKIRRNHPDHIDWSAAVESYTQKIALSLGF
ncbi:MULTISPECIES: hypothetical protein [Chryseobacterium]|nr:MULTISPECIES: hypothetical protein [Chryseobacterium]PWW16971.1 hypothetical protein DEU40_12931 [Chryseobacterium sp. AG844]